MAESVARVKILAQIEGLEGFDKLKGAFKGLQQAIGPADAELEKARKEILAFGEAGTKSQQVIKGQVDALKALQAQASIGGTVYRQLSKDVKALGSAYQEAASGVKQFSDASLKSQKPGAKQSTFGPQIQALKRDLNELSVYSSQYAEKLTEIKRRQMPFDLATGRQGVIAAAEAYRQGPELANAATRMPELPDTTAGLNQRLSELNAEFINLSRGGADWIRVSREIANVQRQLNQEFANPAVEAARRRLEASRNTSSGFLAFSSGLEDRLAVQKSIERNRRKQPIALPDEPMRQISELYRSIGDVGMSRISGDIERMGKSYTEVAQDIRAATSASDGSLGSLQRQRAAWEQLRATISPIDEQYAQIEREARKAISTIDRQIGRQQIGGRGGAAQIGQGLGAVAASGIFGGPEGFIGSAGGAAIGAMMGGPAGLATGAFIGGSAGAYAGMFRQSIAGAGEFAAEVKKLEIALRGVTGSAEEFAKAQQVIKLSGVELNVPVLEATKGFTQLSAAVKGAGGGVNEADVVFRGVTEAIKATGGGAEEVQGALTAMAQIFSKGKVSAEELQGQLGERLPGAVTLFAQATGRTLPQLQKDLEQGVVGLNDVLKFAASLSDKYGEQAAKMASSTEDSTARMKVALDELKVAFGTIVKPITASIQSVIAKLAEMATRALRAVGLVKDGMSELGAVGRAKDLQTRATDAYSALGSGDQSFNEKKEAFRRAQLLANAIKPQQSVVGVQQNLRALQQSRDVIRQITAEGLDERQIALLQNYGKALDGRITKEQQLLKTLKQKRDSELKQFAEPGGEKDTNKELEKALKAQQVEFEKEQQFQESLARSEIALNDKVHENAMELIRTRYEYEQELINKQRDNWVKSQTGGARTVAGIVSQFLGETDQLQGRMVQAQQRVIEATQGLKSAQAMAAVTNGAPAAGPVGAGGIANMLAGTRGGPNINEGVGYGRGRLHAGQDLGIDVGDPIFARLAGQVVKAYASGFGKVGGAVVIRYENGSEGTYGHTLPSVRPGEQVAAGQRIATIAPDGQNTHLHYELRDQMGRLLNPLNAIRESLKVPAGQTRGSGVGAAARRDIAAEGSATVAAQELGQATGLVNLYNEQLSKLTPESVKGFVLDLTDELRQQNAAMEDSAKITALRNRLQAEGMRPEVVDSEVKKAEATLRNNQGLTVLTTLLNAAQAKLGELNAGGKGDSSEAKNAQLQVDAYTQGINNLNSGFGEYIRLTDEATAKQIAQGVSLANYIGQLKLQLAELTNIENVMIRIGQTVETEISTAMSTAISAVVTGSGSVKQVLSDMFQNIGASFIKMATDIIAKQLVMITMQSILKALGGGLFGGGGGGLGGVSTAGVPSFAMPAGGGFAAGFGFAKGGVVSRPTFFKFANGGTMQNGVMGEAGPEAIVPLKRGTDGRLGIAQVPAPQGGDNRMRDMMGRSPAQAPAPVLNMKFETTSIGGVEYVSRDQLELAMAQTRRQAATDGAKRGMNMTLDKIQNSPQTRSRIGVR